MNHPWSGDAACKGMGPARFYIERGAEVDQEVVFTCLMCPVREECLDYALVHERDGYWGGTSSQTRKRLRRQRRINLKTPKAFEVQGCGTAAGYTRHLRNGEEACVACKAGHSERVAAYKAAAPASA